VDAPPCVSYPNSFGNTCSSSGTPTGVVRYTYSETNQLTSLTDWAGDTLTFTYGGNGQQCWVSTYAPSTPSCASPPHQSGSVTTDESYDALGNVSDMKTTTGTASTNLLDLAVGSRSPDEFIWAETPTVGSTAEATDDYGYNTTNEVSSGPITGSSGSTSYTYTPMGSINADTTAFKSAAYTGAGALCWTYTGTSSNSCSSPPSAATVYTSNSDGQRTEMTPSSGNSGSYGWETDSGMLTCANTDGTTCSTSSPTSTTTVYTYDGDGLRTSAKIGSTTTNFTWGTPGDNLNLLSDGTWDYVYANGSATPIEQIAATGSSPTTDLLISDESGNVRGLVQLSPGTHQDQLVNYTDYNAYGVPITQSGGSAETGGLTTSQTGINSNFVSTTPWGFGEGYTDPSGLIYLINRYYDPQSAQFLSSDPLSQVTHQPYEFAADSPLMNVDPSGLQIEQNPYGCQAYIGNAHWANSNPSSLTVKVNTAIWNCSSKPTRGYIGVQLWKTGWPDPHIQDVTSCDSDHPNKLDCKWQYLGPSKHKWQMWDTHTIKLCTLVKGTNSTFYGDMGAEVEIAGVDYTTPGFPDADVNSPAEWEAKNCWTNSPG